MWLGVGARDYVKRMGPRPHVITRIGSESIVMLTPLDSHAEEVSYTGK